MARSRKLIFANLISAKIIEMINAEPDLDQIKTVSLGDLTTLPPDDSINRKEFNESFFPAIYICPTDIYNSSVNGNKSISTTEYHFIIRYLRYFDGDNEYLDVLQSAINEVEILADVLLGDQDLSVIQTRLIEDIPSGSVSLTVNQPCTFSFNSLINLGTETFRIQSIDLSDQTVAVLGLNIATTQDHVINSIVSLTIPANVPKYMELADSNGVPIGQILRTSVPHIGFNTVEQDLFYMNRNPKIPVVTLNIEYRVIFRSYFVI